MQTTRRLMILGAALLAGASRAAEARPASPGATIKASGPLPLSALLAAGRAASASRKE